MADTLPPQPPALDEGPRALEALARRLARQAGALLHEERPAELGVAATKTSDTDVVTLMDRRSEELLRRELALARPGDAVLGEEDGGTPGTSGLTWVLDPIDGTVNYLYGLGSYAVSVACVTGDPARPGAWSPVAGAVFAPVRGELFSACAGGGARLEDARGVHDLSVSSPAGLGSALIATGFGYRSQVRAEQAAVVAALLPRVRDIRREGSAALDLCSVAAGRVDGYYERGTHVWDIAAGALVVTEAGGVLTGPGGGPAGEALVCAAGPALHADLLRAVGG